MRWTLRIDGGPKRVNHAAIAIGDRIYSFGGYCSGDVLCKNAPIDVHVLDTVTFRWHKIPENPPYDYVKEYHRAVAAQRAVTLADEYSDEIPIGGIMLGDVYSDDEEEYLHDGHIPARYRQRNAARDSDEESLNDDDYDFEREFLEDILDLEEVEQVPNPASKILPHPYESFPYQRYGHTVVMYGGKAYLWGGRNDEAGASDILHEYDPIKNEWSIVKINGPSPVARDGHTAVVYHDKMFVYGGFEEDPQLYSQDTFVFDFKTLQWSEFRTSGVPPQYRDFHAACVIDNRMYVFGGRCDESGAMHSNQDYYCNKLKYLDLDTGRWHEPKVGGQTPCGRRSHTLWSYNGKMYLFGGYCSIDDRHFNDLFEFDPKTNTWRKIEPRGAGPCARRRMCTVMVGNQLFLFGGTMPMNRSKQQQLMDLSDLYVLDFCPSLFTLAACTVLKYRINEVFAYALPVHVKDQLACMSKPNKISSLCTRHDAMG
uniref:Kelch domain-containing protein 3 n=1 Tax=Acrobeloides nanus TaxID=290746 RepID=A0A914DQC8_9BILA